MWWNIISLFATLITVTSGHILTLDNGFIIQAPENVTINLEHHNYNITKNEEKNNIFSRHSISNTISSHLGNRTLSRLRSEEDGEDGVHVASHTSSDRPMSNKQYIIKINETKPEQEREMESNEEQRNEKDASIPRLDENNSLEDLLSFENSLQENSNSDAVLDEDLQNKEPGLSESYYITESNFNENTNNEEMTEIPNSRESRSIKKDVLSEGNCVTSSAETAGEPCSTPDRIVHFLNGSVQGYLWQDTDIIGFFDIPYGKIKGPFDAPVAAPPWSDVHDVKNHTKRCPQLHNDEYVGEMDCLTLSIFTPNEAENASVLFHIYDAYSQSKSADPMVYGPNHLVPKGVVLVLPNYRVGPMGFLCMRNETAPGNAGLKDLSLALEWVKQNIHFFGGNTNNIVVSGDGESGAHAGCMALCSQSSDYINKVITESGSALSHLALDRDPLGTARTLAEKIRRALSDDGVIYNNTFYEVELEIIIKSAKNMRFNPCLEHGLEPFMNVTPWEMLHHNKEIDTNFMIGTASFAGAQEAVEATDIFFEQLDANFSQFLPQDLVFTNDDEKYKFAQQLRRQYFGEQTINSSHVAELSLWHTDASYLGPSIRLARPLVRAGAKVYLYEFGFVGSLNRELEAINDSVPGAVRSDIVGYLFHKAEAPVVVDNSPEQHMINLLVNLWVSFINNGKPAAENIEWGELKKTEDSEEEWLLIGSETKPMRGIHLDRLRLWTTLYDEHFIENNAALRYKPPEYLTLLTLLIAMMANKLSYNQ